MRSQSAPTERTNKVIGSRGRMLGMARLQPVGTRTSAETWSAVVSDDRTRPRRCVRDSSDGGGIGQVALQAALL